MNADDQGTVIVNRNASVIAYASSKVIERRNSQGRLLPLLRLIAGCVGFTATAIDDNGAVFGSAYCPSYGAKYVEGIGLRIASSGAQTIGDWLRSAGLPNNLSLNTQKGLVSYDGKTVIGSTNTEPATGGISPPVALSGQEASESA